MSSLGIDVSVANTGHYDHIDFSQVKASGKSFCIVKSSQGQARGSATFNPFRDAKYTENVDGAYANAMQCGAYHYMNGTTFAQVNEEADYCINVLNEKKSKISLPVFIDIEDTSYCITSLKQANTNLVLQFARKLSKAGYYPGIATFAAFYNSFISLSALNEIGIWVSWYGTTEQRVLEVYPQAIAWQMYDGGMPCPGVPQNVDILTGFFDNMPSNQLILINPDTSFYIDYGRRYLVIPKEMTESAISARIHNLNIRITKAQSDADYCGTGSQIDLMAGRNVIKSYTIVVPGDLNGDGKINAADYIMIQRHLAGTLSPALNECQTYAADFNEDGIADEADVTAIRNEILHVEE